jgi:hypothetical protein
MIRPISAILNMFHKGEYGISKEGRYPRLANACGNDEHTYNGSGYGADLRIES